MAAPAPDPRCYAFSPYYQLCKVTGDKDALKRKIEDDLISMPGVKYARTKEDGEGFRVLISLDDRRGFKSRFSAFKKVATAAVSEAADILIPDLDETYIARSSQHRLVLEASIPPAAVILPASAENGPLASVDAASSENWTGEVPEYVQWEGYTFKVCIVKKNWWSHGEFPDSRRENDPLPREPRELVEEVRRLVSCYSEALDVAVAFNAGCGMLEMKVFVLAEKPTEKGWRSLACALSVTHNDDVWFTNVVGLTSNTKECFGVDWDCRPIYKDKGIRVDWPLVRIFEGGGLILEAFPHTASPYYRTKLRDAMNAALIVEQGLALSLSESAGMLITDPMDQMIAGMRSMKFENDQLKQEKTDMERKLVESLQKIVEQSHKDHFKY